MIKHGALTLSDRDGDGNLWVVSCEKTATEVEIPLRVEGKPVVGIGAFAFRDCRELVRVDFPEADEEGLVDGVMLSVIEENAFMDCRSLAEISLSYSIFSVGHGAFYGCTSLRRAEMPSDPYLAPYAFYNCKALASVSPTSYVSEGVFSGCSSLTEMPITASVDEISEDAFESCEGLTELVIPERVRRIEALAFRGCGALRSVTFEITSGWVEINSYAEEDIPLDLADPAANAERLSRMDFDDGVIAWERRE